MVAAPTFRQFVAGPWKAACYDRCKPSTRRRMDSALQMQLLPTFGARPLDRIRRAAVHLWFDCYSRTAPGGANRTLDVLRQILNHAIACGHLATNPTRSVTRNPRPKLTRFLSRAEIDHLHAALDVHQGRGSGQQQAEIIRLLLLTGCRKGELVCLRWLVDRWGRASSDGQQDGTTDGLPERASSSHPGTPAPDRDRRMSFPRRLIHRSPARPNCRSGAKYASKPGSRTCGCTTSAIPLRAMR